MTGIFPLPLTLLAIAVSGPPSSLPENVPATETIVEKALERAEWNRRERVESRFASRLLRVSEKLDGDGDLLDREELLYDVAPLPEFDGIVLETLIRKNGRELTPQEEREESRRRDKAVAALRERKDPRREDRDERVEFDRRLVGKYQFALEGIEPLNDRPAYVLRYRPRDGKLPVETRMDRALNKAHGRLWVDVENWEIARVEIHLDEKVNIWWGIVGSIRALRGTIERVEVEQGLWMTTAADFYLNGRILFNRLHRSERLAWSDFRLLSPDREISGSELFHNETHAGRTAHPGSEHP